MQSNGRAHLAHAIATVAYTPSRWLVSASASTRNE